MFANRSYANKSDCENKFHDVPGAFSVNRTKVIVLKCSRRTHADAEHKKYSKGVCATRVGCAARRQCVRQHARLSKARGDSPAYDGGGCIDRKGDEVGVADGTTVCGEGQLYRRKRRTHVRLF